MPPAHGPFRRGSPRFTAAFTATIAAALAVSPAVAAELGSSGAVLSPRLAELATPAVRNAPPAAQARRLSVAPRGPGSLLRDGNRVLVYARFADGAASAGDRLRAAGAKVVDLSGRYQTATVAVRPDQLRALPAVPGVIGVSEALAPVVAASGGDSQASVVTPCFGAATSEGDEQLRAAEARKEFGVDGSGVAVGILSDSFAADEFAASTPGDDVESGDLPGPGNPCGHTAPIAVLDEIEESEEGADEGRAMAQIVHDLAPGATLAFASAFNGEPAFAKNIERLAEPVGAGGAGAQVIADDVFYLDEPFFQDGPVAVAVNHVAAEGKAYFSAAGNDNLVEEPAPGVENEIASWEAPSFRDAGACPTGAPAYAAHCMDFSPGAPVDNGFQITVEPESTLVVDLQWAQPWHGVTTDLDAYLLGGSTRVAEIESANIAAGLQEPVEILAWDNASESPRTVTLAIDRCNLSCGVARAAANPKLTGTTGGDSSSPRLKFALLENGGGVSATEYPASGGGDTVGPTIFGHSGAAGAVSVGAVPFFDSSEPEYYSSRGPVTHYFGPVEGPSAAPALGSPEELAKPDVVATDGGANTFFGSCLGHVWRFFGTSAAAPHAAAVAALELSAGTSPSVAEAIAAQKNTARPVGAFPPTAAGSGLIDAVGAVAQVLGTTGSVEPVAGPGAPPPDCTEEAEGPNFKAIEEKIVAASPAAPLPATGKIPSTFFRHHPRHLIRTTRRAATAVFRFGSDESGATFLCQVDRGPVRTCPERFTRLYGVGAHVVRAMARDAEERVDLSPAVFRFRVEQRG